MIVRSVQPESTHRGHASSAAGSLQPPPLCMPSHLQSHKQQRIAQQATTPARPATAAISNEMHVRPPRSVRSHIHVPDPTPTRGRHPSLHGHRRVRDESSQLQHRPARPCTATTRHTTALSHGHGRRLFEAARPSARGRRARLRGRLERRTARTARDAPRLGATGSASRSCGLSRRALRQPRRSRARRGRPPPRAAAHRRSGRPGRRHARHARRRRQSGARRSRPRLPAAAHPRG